MKRILTVGLEQEDVATLKSKLNIPIIASDVLAPIQLQDGNLFVEDPYCFSNFLPISHVVFHGIFDVENDMPFLCALALWNGHCLPKAKGMMDCRLRIPCLVRTLEVTKFGKMVRGMMLKNTETAFKEEKVIKWGEWHCGENKDKVKENYFFKYPTLVEPFIHGTAVRIMLIGEKHWQISLSGEDWKKSIHHSDAKFMPADPELVEDTKAIAKYFQLEVMAVDYIVNDQNKYLLEVNHIPNVDHFPEIHAYYLDFVVAWCHS